jgi:predicted kinase
VTEKLILVMILACPLMMGVMMLLMWRGMRGHRRNGPDGESRHASVLDPERMATSLPTPTLVVVSGPPRTGTTTLAHALARAIPCPAICRDELKEGMVHAEGGEFEAAAGDPLTRRTLPVFFDVLRLLATAGVTVVAEAAFQDRVWRSGLEPLSELAELRIVQCHVDAAVARERRRTAHEAGAITHAPIVGDELEDWERALASFERLSLPAPSLDVDTTDSYAPSFDEIVAFVRG